MSMKTLNNMGLIIEEMNKQLLSQEDLKGVKALSHSYETLLHQLDYKHDDFKNHSLIDTVLEQKEMMVKILNVLETTSIPQLLRMNMYLDVNHLTTTVARVNAIFPHLDHLINKLYEKNNPSVLIVSATRKGEEYLFSMIEENCENIIYLSPTVQRSVVRTDKYNYEVEPKFSMNCRGRRYDIVHIDKDLNNDEIKLAMNFVKPEGQFKLF